MYQVDTRELRKKMIDADIATIAGLAEASGVDRNTIGAILSEKARPSSAVIDKIAEALGMEGEDIGRIFFATELS